MNPIPSRRPLVDAPTTPPPLSNNPLAIAGFATSLAGLPMCGMISPIALVLSVIGLFKEPRGLAIAGTAIGTLGTVFGVWFGFGIAGTVLGFKRNVQSAGQTAQTMVTAQQAYLAIEAANKSGDPLPLERGSAISKQFNDAWGTPLRYRPEYGSYVIRSAGPDKKFRTEDDVEFLAEELEPAKPGQMQPVDNDEDD